MTRDFLIEFSSKKDAIEAQNTLNQIKVNNKLPMFGNIDNRGLSLFVTLTYPDEIKSNTIITINSNIVQLDKEVVFVAIKNGMHQSKGFSFYSKGLKDYIPENNVHVKHIHQTISSFLA